MVGRGKITVLWLPTVIGLWFSYGYAAKYFTRDTELYGIYLSRHQWLYYHIIAGLVALLLGPTQLFLGLNRRISLAHHLIGLTYVSAVAVGGVTAFYLAAYNDFGWVFAVGFASMAAAWLIATLLATIAIALRNPEQHREWMIRSYVLTFGFVIFRAVTELLDLASVGTLVERQSGAVWIAWAVPLFITETILQARKIFAARQRVAVVETTLAASPHEVMVE